MPDHVFISYGRTDRAYVESLATYLRKAGVEVWYDHALGVGDDWEKAVAEMIDTSAAFVVVMTPEAEDSKWVKREINRADDMNKPVYPLLLAGGRFFSLSERQYEDVRGGAMPTPALVEVLRQHTEGDPVEDERESESAVSTAALDSDGEAAFEIMRHIYTRATTGATTRRVLDFLRRVTALGTRIEIGKSTRTRDGRSDYVMVSDAESTKYGAVVYVKPGNGGLTLRLRPADVVDIDNPRVRVRNVKPNQKYAINCPLHDDEAVDLAVLLTERALARVRS